MFTFWERAANSVVRLCLSVNMVVSHFGFECRNVVLIALVPGQCLQFTCEC